MLKKTLIFIFSFFVITSGSLVFAQTDAITSGLNWLESEQTADSGGCQGSCRLC